MAELEFHPVADIFPMMSELEFSGLVDDIKANGLQVPVWLHRDGRIIDGRNRYRACQQIGVQPAMRTYEGADEGLIAFVVSLNLHRRHLDSDQRSMVAARIANMRQGERTDLVEISTKLGLEDAADLLKVSRESASAARQVLASGDEDLIREAEKGRKEGGLSISAAAAAAKLEADKRREFLERAERERTARVAKQMKRDEAEARQMMARLSEPEPVDEPVAAPEGQYKCIVIDPPWPIKKIEREERPDQGVALDYPTLPVWCRNPDWERVVQIKDGYESHDSVSHPCSEILKDADLDTLEDYEPCQSIECIAAHVFAQAAADDCHIYLWVTHKFLPTGLDLLKSWGFTYQCVMTWRKNVGITPFSWMYDTEHVLFARRGNLPLSKLGLRLSFDAATTGHSTKPDVFYDRVLAASPAPRLEMFSRRQRDGFTAWGNEVNQ